jgi:site-specific DNA recombinase
MLPSMSKATAAYIRVSTQKQLNGSGPAQQRDSIIAYAVSKGLEINDWRTDDETGTTEDREQIQALLQEAREGRLGTLIVDRVDRLGRELHVCEGLYDAFTKAGCKVLIASQALEDSAEGVLLRQILGSFASYQRKALLKHLSQCRESKARRIGYRNGGAIPYGYKLSEKGDTIVPDEDHEAPMVRRMFQLRGEGYSYTRALETLFAEGYRSRRNTPLQRMQLQRIFRLESAYRGEVSFFDCTLPATHEGILKS